ncbi:SAM-dependent methyltransferase [Oricola sp.]|uniref:SAM-dependent methyltransferase n=1 Tax=Oricola sp. TaxID=1979950 RepID=UPI003BAA0D8D
MSEAPPNQAEFWNERYDRPDYLFGTEPNDFLRATAPAARPGQTAFAPADGEGRNGVFLAALGYAVTTVDISEPAVEKARRLAAARGVTINAVVADFFATDWPEAAFDLAAVSFMHFRSPLSERFHATIARSLKPGGLLILEGYHLDQMDFDSGGPKVPEMLFTRAMLERHFAELDIVLLQQSLRMLAEGPRHRGEAATVQLVARKRGA